MDFVFLNPNGILNISVSMTERIKIVEKSYRVNIIRIFHFFKVLTKKKSKAGFVKYASYAEMT